MPDDMENAPGDRRWRSAETFQGFLDHMEEFRPSPQGQQLQADQQSAEADLQAWLADQPGVVIGRHDGQVPEQWEGQVDLGVVAVDPEPPGGVVSTVNQGVVGKASVLARGVRLTHPA